MIYIIQTSSLIAKDFEKRQEQYTKGINSVIKRYENNENIKIVIVENNGNRTTFLDNFGVPVLYTENNKYPTNNIGAKEILDVFACINYFGIQDEDFIVKFGARYHVVDDCPFFDQLDKNIDYDCIAKEINERDYFTGLIGMRCKYVKQIKIPNGENIELMWANVGKTLKNKLLIPIIGMNICPNSHEFFLY